MTNETQTQRRASSSQWHTDNPVLDPGEFAFETDSRIYKVGDGAKTWEHIITPYLPADLVKAKGDLITYGVKSTELLTNNPMTADTNNDGVTDGWIYLASDPSLATVSVNGQRLVASPTNGAGVRHVVDVRAGDTYKFSVDMNLTSHGDPGMQTDVLLQYYTDSTLVYPQGVPFDSQTTETSPLGHSIITTTFGPFADDGVVGIELWVWRSAAAIFTDVSFAKVENEAIALSTAGSVPGSSLYLDADGLLQWSDTSTSDRLAPYITSAAMEATYQTKSAANAAHAQYLLAADALATYETIDNANIAHALHQYAAAAATDYYTPASLLAANYELKDQSIRKTADHTVTNSTAYSSDTELLFAMEANATYLFELFLIVTGTTANGMRISLLAPSCVFNIWGVHAPAPLAGVTSGLVHQAVSTGNAATPGTQSVGLDGTTPLFATCRGTITNGTSAGTATWAVAQNTAAASTSCTIKTDSFMRVIKIS